MNQPETVFFLISIHAPAKGATILRITFSFPSIISIHAPAKGATSPSILNAISFVFQSTLPRRERQMRTFLLLFLSSISIHAPAKGATQRRNVVDCHFLISIHAPAKGATICRLHLPCFQRFQSTLPRRERQQYFTNPQVNIVKH